MFEGSKMITEELPFGNSKITIDKLRSKRYYQVFYDGGSYVGRFLSCDYKRVPKSDCFRKVEYWFGRLNKTIENLYRASVSEGYGVEETVKIIVSKFRTDRDLDRLIGRTFASDERCRDRREQLTMDIAIQKGRLEDFGNSGYLSYLYGEDYRKRIEARVLELETQRNRLIEKIGRFDEFVRSLIEHIERAETEKETERERRNRLFEETSKQALKDGLRGEKYLDYMLSVIPEKFGEELTEELKTYIFEKCGSSYRNYRKRKKLFLRKARLNCWNYFVTFTCDSAKMSEGQFKSRLSKCLANLSVRRNWRYMGVWERGEKEGRLHFHALLYVPPGEQIGDFEIKKDFSLRKYRMIERNENSFFLKRFGRNDFEPLPTDKCTPDHVIRYIGKYITKSDERIVYGRYIPAVIIKELADWNLFCRLYDYSEIYVLNDGVIDRERDIRRSRFGEQLSIFWEGTSAA